MLTALLLIHGDDVRMENIYFWSAVLIFGGIGVWIVRKVIKERREDEVLPP